MLAWTIYLSFFGALVLMLLPKGNAAAARKVAMLSAVAGLSVALAGFVQAAPEIKLGKIVTLAKVPWVPSLGIEYHIETQDTYSIVKGKIPEGKTTCSLCSRLRRGIIYKVAGELGANKIALGHHRDDMIETLFLNMFFGGKLKAMPPKLVTDKGDHVVIRPLAYCAEKDIARYARGMEFPIIPCNLCGAQENLQRQNIKQMLAAWEREYPGRSQTIFTAMQNVAPSHLLDGNLFDFKNVRAGAKVAEGDVVFDDEVE